MFLIEIKGVASTNITDNTNAINNGGNMPINNKPILGGNSCSITNLRGKKVSHILFKEIEWLRSSASHRNMGYNFLIVSALLI
jgi:hypothetical protein